MIELKNISLSFDKELIRDSQFVVQDNQITVLSGLSGSGKSSLLYDIAFLSHQCRMNYLFDGKDVQTLTQDEIKDIQRKKISFVFQNIPLFNSMNLMENIRFFTSLSKESFDEEKAREYLTELELFLDDSTNIEHMSGGERQRLAIVCALMKDTPYIFMDEPTAYLDEDNRVEFLKILDLLKNRYHKTILIASHDSTLYEVCDNLYEIKDYHIECIKKANEIVKKKEEQAISQYQFRGLSYFYKCGFLKNKWKHRIFQVFLTVILFMSTFSGMYLQYYQKELNRMVEEYRSSQFIVEMTEKISGEKLRELEGIPNVKSVQKVNPLISDNQYLICPYLENDFFKHDIERDFRNKSYTGVYINYETYRHTNDNPIEVVIDGKSTIVYPQYQLNKSFHDYKFQNNLARVIYLPYEDYLRLYQEKEGDLPIQSSYALISLEDNQKFLETLEILLDKDASISLPNQFELVMLINIKDATEHLTSSMMIFISAIIILSLMIIKILDNYHLRFSQVLLEANGISTMEIGKEYIKREVLEYVIPFIVSYCLLLLSYVFFDMLNLQTLLYSFIILLGSTFIVFILSLIIYVVINKMNSTIKILKKS